VRLTEDYGSYKKGNVWAEPDIAHAADLMQYVFNNYEEAKQVGAKAAQDIQSLLSPKVIGEKIKKRLEYIMQIRKNNSEIYQLQTELQYKNAENYRLQTLVNSMESSKFWHLRNQWLKIKEKLIFNNKN
jgi:microcompartment protein CcmL/EutN